jgi:hypothetical protein
MEMDAAQENDNKGADPLPLYYRFSRDRRALGHTITNLGQIRMAKPRCTGNAHYSGSREIPMRCLPVSTMMRSARISIRVLIESPGFNVIDTFAAKKCQLNKGQR